MEKEPVAVIFSQALSKLPIQSKK